MIDTHIKTTFPVYDDIEKQNFRRAWCMGDVSTFALITSSLRFLPMQWKRALNGQDFADMTFVLWAWDDAFSTDITSIIPAADFNITSVDGDDWITYFGNLELTSEMNCGIYYLAISDGVTTWWTEVFQVKQFETSSDLRKVRVISDAFPRTERKVDLSKTITRIIGD